MSRAALAGAILIGGESRRMGRPKSALDYRGKSFAARVAEALRAVAREAFFVGDGELPADVPPLPRLADVAGIAGPLGGVLAALRHRPESAWLIAACDLPLIDARATRWLAAQRAGQVAILPRLAPDRVEPLFALYEPASRILLEALAARGERSLQSLGGEVDVSTPEPPPELAPAWRNVNTPADLDRLQSGERSSSP